MTCFWGAVQRFSSVLSKLNEIWYYHFLLRLILDRNHVCSVFSHVPVNKRQSGVLQYCLAISWLCLQVYKSTSSRLSWLLTLDCRERDIQTAMRTISETVLLDCNSCELAIIDHTRRQSLVRSSLTTYYMNTTRWLTVSSADLTEKKTAVVYSWHWQEWYHSKAGIALSTMV